MDVAFECGRLDTQPKLTIQIINKPVNEMVRSVVAPMDQRIVCDHGTNTRLLFLQRCEMRIVLPERGTRGAHVGQETARVGSMQVADCGRKHNEVARR